MTDPAAAGGVSSIARPPLFLAVDPAAKRLIPVEGLVGQIAV